MAEAVDADATASNGVDVQALIEQFLQDPAQKSLELPTSLTVEQRKEAKRLADQHSGLKCESYGFGAERQLHLFKKGTQLAQAEAQDVRGSSGAVRVKNTFIDDWAEGGDEDAEPLCFRSMPAGSLLEKTLQRCAEEQAEAESQAEAAAATSSTAGVESAAPAGSSTASCSASTGQGLPALPEGTSLQALQVRNTFIHIESMPTVERIVQSMPDGMFRHCLQAELSAQSGGYANATPAVASAVPVVASAASTDAVRAPPYVALPADGGSFAPGTEVIIQNLVKLPAWNGCAGVVQALDAETGRYDVLLELTESSSGWKWVKVKGENLLHKVPPPPRNAPTLSADVDIQGDPGQPPASSPSGGGIVPPTPKWEDDYSTDAARGRVQTPLTLNALV